MEQNLTLNPADHNCDRCWTCPDCDETWCITQRDSSHQCGEAADDLIARMTRLE